jgi:hypothetical protein
MNGASQAQQADVLRHSSGNRPVDGKEKTE